jgi:isopropylmalate/homocitrate/citramalate synthase
MQVRGTINIPDTVGYAIPQQFGELIHNIITRVPNADKAIFSVHCHNDLGLAVSNSLAAVLNGARQVECTINGLGERAGNAALEEMVMGIRTRSDLFAVETVFIPPKLYQLHVWCQGLRVFLCSLIKPLWVQMPLLMNQVFIKMVY